MGYAIGAIGYDLSCMAKGESSISFITYVNENQPVEPLIAQQ